MQISPPATHVLLGSDKQSHQASHQVGHPSHTVHHPVQSTEPANPNEPPLFNFFFFFTANMCLGRVKYPMHVLLQHICVCVYVCVCVCVPVCVPQCIYAEMLSIMASLVWIVADSAVSCWFKNCATLTLQSAISLPPPWPACSFLCPAH